MVNCFEKGRNTITAKKLKKAVNVVHNEHLLRFTDGSYDIMIFKDGRALIKGTDDIKKAKSLYSKYIGY